jgi:SAM-dependent methyltransferase
MTVLPLVPAGLVVVALLLGALRLRGRLAALPTLAPAGDDPGGYRVVTAAGVMVGDDVLRAAAAHAHRQGLAAVDLVPGDLPVAQAYALARQVDPAAYRTDRLAPGRGAGHALVVAVALLTRAGVTKTAGLDPAEIIRLTERLKKYAPTEVDVAVAPALRAVPADPATRKARLRAVGAVVPLSLTMPVIGYGLLVAAVLARPAWGWVALVAYSLQPCLAAAGTPLRPRDRHSGAWLRLLLEPVRCSREVRGRWRSAYDVDRDELRERARGEYVAELAHGVDRFFEPRRDTCPWCGDPRLSVLVDTPDRIQAKPGLFVLEECRACRHVFQNPRLSLAGLDFYYRDMYDRLGEDTMELVFGLSAESYRGRADLVRRFTTPLNWLDIGTGHGHFCLYAKGVLPDTVFDGLDMSEAIEEAQRRGWVATGYRGLFPDLADKLADSYDVVSMHHYLEHTRDPRAEIDAAARVVAPGGYLLIEVPNPRSRLGRLLGGYWIPWFQPEHLNLLPLPNLEDALRERGLEPVAAEMGPAHQSCDFMAATLLWLNSLVPDPDRPWAPAPGTAGRRFGRAFVFTASAWLVVAAVLLDRAVGAVLRRTQGGNTYRVLARRVGSPS